MVRLGTLAAKSLHFTETGTFFHALLGVVVVCKRASDWVQPPSEPAPARARAPHPADYLVLGVVSLKGRLLHTVAELAQTTTAAQSHGRTPKQRSGVLR